MNSSGYTSLRDAVIGENNPNIAQLDAYVRELIEYVSAKTVTDEPDKKLDKVLPKFNKELFMELMALCRNVVTGKYYITTTSDDMEETDHHGVEQRKKRLISQNKVLTIFWEYCKDKLNEIQDSIIDRYIEKLREPPEPLDKRPTLSIWKLLYSNYEFAIRRLIPIIEYVYRNHYYITSKDINKGNTFDDFLKRTLFSKVIDRMNDNKDNDDNGINVDNSKYYKFLIQLINELQTTQLSNLINEPDEYQDSPLRLQYLLDNDNKHNESVTTNNEINISKIYLTEINNRIDAIDYLQWVNKECFLENFMMELERQAYLSKLISPSLIEPVNEAFVTKILMNRDVLRAYYKICLDCTMRQSDHKLYHVDLNPLIERAFLSRSRGNEYNDIMEDCISYCLGLHYDVKDRSTLIQVFASLETLLEVFVKNDNVQPLYFKNACCKLFGGEIKLMENMIKFWELHVTNREIYLPWGKGFSTIVLDEQKMSKMIYVLRIQPKIIELYSKSLFRRLLLDCNNLKSTFDRGRIADGLIISGLIESFPKNTPEIDTLISLKQDISNAFQALDQYHADNDANGTISFESLILNKNTVPTVFQKTNTDEKIKLPRDMEDKWEDFRKFYNKRDKKNDMKIVTPIYELQHCEVETEYLIPYDNNDEEGSGKNQRLILELTLYQTCVLYEFNERDSVTFKSLREKTGMGVDNLNNVLNSFVRIGLLKYEMDAKTQKKKFVLNNGFKPDIRKIKNGKLRVALVPNIRPGLSRGSASTRSNISSSSSRLSNDGKTEIPESDNDHHSEGPRSTWISELLRACIMRNIKAHHPEGLTLERIIQLAREQRAGTSVGEVKDALDSLVQSKYTSSIDGKYIFE